MFKRNVVIIALVTLAATGCAGDVDSVTATTTRATTTSSMAASTTTGAVKTGLFADPEGTYEMTIGPDWVPNHGALAVGWESWAIGETVSGFTPNINILTQTTPTGMGIEEYLELSIEGADALIPEFTLISQDIVDGTSGQQLGLMEYEGSPTGQLLRFLGVFGMRSSQAVVATLTAPPEDFETLRIQMEPYLLTLRPIP